jgi:hypothetical protein
LIGTADQGAGFIDRAQPLVVFSKKKSTTEGVMPIIRGNHVITHPEDMTMLNDVQNIPTTFPMPAGQVVFSYIGHDIRKTAFTATLTGGI